MIDEVVFRFALLQRLIRVLKYLPYSQSYDTAGTYNQDSKYFSDGNSDDPDGVIVAALRANEDIPADVTVRCFQSYLTEEDGRFPLISILEHQGGGSVLGRQAIAALARDNEAARYFDSVDLGPRGNKSGGVEYGLVLQGWDKDKEHTMRLLALVKQALVSLRSDESRMGNRLSEQDPLRLQVRRFCQGLDPDEYALDKGGMFGFGSRSPMVRSLEFGRGFVGPAGEIGVEAISPDNLSFFLHVVIELVEDYERPFVMVKSELES